MVFRDDAYPCLHEEVVDEEAFAAAQRRVPALVRAPESSGAAGNRTRVPRPRHGSSTSVVCGQFLGSGPPADGGGRGPARVKSPAPSLEHAQGGKPAR